MYLCKKKQRTVAHREKGAGNPMRIYIIKTEDNRLWPKYFKQAYEAYATAIELRHNPICQTADVIKMEQY